MALSSKVVVDFRFLRVNERHGDVPCTENNGICESCARPTSSNAALSRSGAERAHGLLRQLQSVDRINYSIFQRFNLEWKSRTIRILTQAA